MASSKLLLVEDDEKVAKIIGRFLRDQGYEVKDANSVGTAVPALASFQPEVVVLDHQLPDGTALDILERVQLNDPDVPVVILTGHGTIDIAVKAIKAGAEQFLTKPVDLGFLATVIERSLVGGRLKRRDGARRRRGSDVLNPFAGRSRFVRALQAEAELAARSDSPVLIQGGTGTGKGVLARWLHESGLRSAEPFVDINCAGLSRELLESELFGHASGAFTGAVREKPGLIEVAHRGTFFLDEIGDVDAAIQPKLLKVIEEKRFRRVGENRERTVNVRLIAATNRSLAEDVVAGRFREDLLYRINTLVLELPSLADRLDDLPVLAEVILDRLGGEMGFRKGLSISALEALKGHAWPGNIRELRNVLERALLVSAGREIKVEDLRIGRSASASRSEPDSGPGSAMTITEMERWHIDRVLREVQGRVVDAAGILGIPRSTLYQKVKLHGIDLNGYRAEGSS